MASNDPQVEAQIAETSEKVDADVEWIARAKRAAARESRWQPWRETLQHQKVGSGFEGEDESTVRRRDDVQHSNVTG